ncbi:MAG: MarR family transcriptional regulator [Pseudomonadota bacterium]
MPETTELQRGTLRSLRERFTVDLVRVARRWRWCLDKRLGRTGLTQARWTTLLHLSRGGEGMTQRELADFLVIEAATLSPLLDSLSQRGFVERRPDPTDRRRNTVHLTPAAGPALAEIETIADQLRAELTSGIDSSDLETCIRVLTTIRERLADPSRSSSAE